MTLAQLRNRKPLWARAYTLAVTKGLGKKETARRLKVAGGTAGFWIQRARELLREGAVIRTGILTPEDIARVDAKLFGTARCECGLLQPCWSCVRKVRDVASARPGVGAAYPEGGW